MKLLKFHLRYHPPGIVLEYIQKGIVKNKDIDLLDLNSNSDIKEIAKRLYQKELLITEEVYEQLEQCLETLKKRIEHEGPTGKRFYIYKTLQTHVLPLTNVCFDKNGNRCLSGSYDRTCKVWDVESGKELQTLTGHQNVVYAVGFNFPTWFVFFCLKK